MVYSSTRIFCSILYLFISLVRWNNRLTRCCILTNKTWMLLLVTKHQHSSFLFKIWKNFFFNLSLLSVLLFKDIYLVASDISFTSPFFQHCYSKVYCISRNLIFSFPFSHHSHLMAYNIWYQNTLFSPFLSFYLFPRHQLFAGHIAARTFTNKS